MQLNITFFIQVINFSITYWFLNKFMFKPVIKFLENKKGKEKKVKDDIANKEKVLLDLENSKLEDLQAFKKKIKKQYKISPILESKIPSRVFSPVDKRETEKLVNIAEKILIEKVLHVD